MFNKFVFKTHGSLFFLSCSRHHSWVAIYTLARRYKFYVRAAKTISHLFASLTSETLFLPHEHKIQIFSPLCKILNISNFHYNLFCSLLTVIKINFSFLFLYYKATEFRDGGGASNIAKFAKI